MYLNQKSQRLNSGFGNYVQASKPKYWPESIGIWLFSPSSSLFLPVPPPSSVSSFFIPLVGIFLKKNAHKWEIFFSYQWDEFSIPLVGIWFFPTGEKKILPTRENSPSLIRPSPQPGLFVFSRVHATLHSALSVGWLVCWSVGHILLFLSILFL